MEHGIHRDGDAALVLAGHGFPMMIATWFGHPTDTLVRAFFSWHADTMRRAMAEQVKIVAIHDALDGDMPQSETRALMADYTRKQQTMTDACVLDHIVVLSSVMVRGGLTALSWLNPGVRFRSVATMSEAIGHARALLAKADMSVSSGSNDESYRRPLDPRK